MHDIGQLCAALERKSFPILVVRRAPTYYIRRVEGSGQMFTESKRVPKGGVVIIGSLSDATRERVAKETGEPTKTIGSPLTHVIETTATNLRKLSQKINKVVGTEAVVAPLLADGEGNQLVPTGRMQVRFKEPPSDKSLAAFAKRHKVELTQRNKWSSQQAEFAVRTDDTRYFPDVAAELNKDAKVVTAWPDVRAAFRREA